MNSIVKKDLEKKDDDKSSDEYVGFYDSNKIVYEQRGDYFGILDKIKSFRHFGFFQLIGLLRWVTSLVNDFSKFVLFSSLILVKVFNSKRFLANRQAHLFVIKID